MPISTMWLPSMSPITAGFAGLHTDLHAKICDMMAGTHVPGTVVISGETGCGKTTLIKHVVRQLITTHDAVVGVPMPLDQSRIDVETEEALRNVSAATRARASLCCACDSCLTHSAVAVLGEHEQHLLRGLRRAHAPWSTTVIRAPSRGVCALCLSCLRCDVRCYHR